MPSLDEFLIYVTVFAVANFLTRVIPFAFFSKHKPPHYIEFIGKYFPPIIITILIFYTLKDSNFTEYESIAKQMSAISLTLGLQIIAKNYLLSVFGGTAFYIYLVNDLL